MLNNTFQLSAPRQFGISSGNFLPARLDAEQAAKVLGFNDHDIPILVSRSLLEPLGRPADNARKYFALVKILECAEDPAWLGRATRTLYQHWQDKNASRKLTSGDETSHAE
jgi:hypothetical protein